MFYLSQNNRVRFNNYLINIKKKKERMRRNFSTTMHPSLITLQNRFDKSIPKENLLGNVFSKINWNKNFPSISVKDTFEHDVNEQLKYSCNA